MTTFMSAIHRPEYGPFQPGRDSVGEILATVADIAALSPSEQHQHFEQLVATYPAAALADALLCLANGTHALHAHQESAAPMSGPPPR